MKGGIFIAKTRKQIIEELEKNPDKIIPLITDSIIKKVLKKYKKLIVYIMEAVGEEIKEEEINFKDPKNSPERNTSNREKDIIFKNNKRLYGIEINNNSGGLSIIKRNLTYVGDMLMEYDYAVIQININNGRLPKDKEKLLGLLYYPEIKEEMTEVLKIYMLSIPKFKEMSYTNSKYRKEFIQFMKMLTLDSKKEIEEVIKGSKVLKEVYEMQKKLSSRKFYIHEYAEKRCMEDYAKEQLELSRDEGISIGENNKTLELAKKMLKENISTDVISKVTGLSKKVLMTII